MPELPEVEHVRHQLVSLIGPPKRVSGLSYFRPDLRFPLPPELPRTIKGKSLLGIERRAKYLLFEFSDGWMLSHLGMSGAWRELKTGENRRLHDHVGLDFEDGPSLIFNDPRRFGFIEWVKLSELRIRLRDLGPEPFDLSWSGAELFDRLRGRKSSIKSMIMDQKIVVGVGNIYASEALFRASVRPTRPAGRVTMKECDRIVSEIRSVLQEAISSGGSTIRTYRSADGSEGGFQSRLFVYDRAGLACRKCEPEKGRVSKISMRIIAGRSTYWCSRCQPS